MRKTIIVALSFIFLLLSAISCFASTSETDYIEDNTVLFIQANGNQLYKFITETLIGALNSKVPSEKEQAMDAVKKWIDAGFDSLKNKSSSEIAEMLKDWNQNGYFIPNGAIKFAFYNDNTTYLSLAAKTDLKRLFEASKNYAKQQDLSVKETHDTVSFVHKNGTETKFTSTGLRFA